MSFYSQRQYRPKSAAENFMERLIYLNHLGEDRPGPQLDIGCSIGNFVNLDPGRIEGIDLDADALQICKERGLPCRHLDVEKEDLPSEHYEVIYFRHVIEHLNDPLSILKKLQTALRPGGLLIVETPDYVTAHHRKEKNFWDDYTHKRPFTFVSLVRIALDSGFIVHRKMRKPHYGYFTKKLLRGNRISYAIAFAIHSRLNIVLDDLLFVLEKPKANPV